MPTVTMERKSQPAKEAKGSVYCPLCTHTVDAMITYSPRSARVNPGQKCARCSSSLDAGYVLRVQRAA
jgi:transposase-like protein